MVDEAGMSSKLDVVVSVSSLSVGLVRCWSWS